MLNPSSDRLNYGNILTPPIGYKLDFAIGTTYSLDLQALISSSLSLGLSKQTDSNLVNDPVFLLEAIRRTSENVALFCEKGRISLHKEPKNYHILLEDMFFEVDNPNSIKNNYYSFHPKFWLLRFIDEDENILYRLIVLSRNLTFDRSWDVSFTMEGYKTNELINVSMGYNLSKYKNKFEKMDFIAKELKQVHFSLESNVFEDFDFIINGIDEEYSIQNFPLSSDNLDELFIMSPFLNQKVIDDFNNRKNKKSKGVLISRDKSLGLLKPDDCSNFEVYTLKKDIVCGESKVSSDDSEESHNNFYNQDIHAKMYLIEKDDTTELYLGSLNASSRALHGNIELMIRLKTSRDKFNFNNLIEDLFNGEKDNQFNPFEFIPNVDEFDDDFENNRRIIELYMNEIIRLDIKAEVIENGEKYNLQLDINNFKENKSNGVHVQIKPLFLNDYINISKKILFEDLQKIQLSEFFILKFSKDDVERKTIIKVPIPTLPEDRQKEVISSMIENEENFRKYVELLLKLERSVQKKNKKSKHNGVNINISTLSPDLYEKMLKASVESPEIIKYIDNLIKNLTEDKIPNGFKELHNTFLKACEEYGRKN